MVRMLHLLLLCGALFGVGCSGDGDERQKQREADRAAVIDEFRPRLRAQLDAMYACAPQESQRSPAVRRYSRTSVGSAVVVMLIGVPPRALYVLVRSLYIQPRCECENAAREACFAVRVRCVGFFL